MRLRGCRSRCAVPFHRASAWRNSCRLLPNLRRLLLPRHLHDARDEKPRRRDALLIERAQFDGLVDLGDGALRRARHGWAEVARALAVDEVAPAVAALRF